MNAGLLLLAAGQGRRAGGPKAWHPVRGRPWLAWQIEAASRLDFDSILVVLPHAPPKEHRRLFRTAHWTVNPQPDPGFFTSLIIGLRVLEPRDAPAFVQPVDVPLPDERALQGLLEGLVPGAVAAVPSHRGRGGHPVLLGPQARAELLAMNLAMPGARLDRWLRAKGPKVRRVETDDPRILLDLDRAEDFQKLELP